jgi:PAS domain S-box-containing protein
MIARGAPVGVLSVFFGTRDEFTETDAELMRVLADHAAIAIQNNWSAESLRSAYSQTEDLLASISWILVAVDELDAIVRWNAAAEAAFGLSAGTVIARPLADAEIRWDWPDVSAYIEDARGKDHPTKLDDVRYRRADGSDGFLSLTLTPLRGSTGFLLLCTDITDRRLLESQITQNQKLESIGELAAGVAHELNTPIQFVGDNVRFLDSAFAGLLGVVRACVDLRRAVSAGPVDEALLVEIDKAMAAADLDYLGDEIPRAISQTLEGITRVATIVRALKEFAHPDRKEKVAADLNQALRSTLIVARNEVKYVADVETDFHELPLVSCWPGEISQVFLNVIVNAAHAIADVVAGTEEKGLIRVQTRREGDTAVIAISDTGGGIPDAIAGKVFDPFFTTKEIGRGTGQGLAIARGVVTKHGGSLTFDAEAGRGTTFFIRIPINDVDAVLETAGA